MKTSQGNAVQQRWLSTCHELGMGHIVHHATDRTMKIKGVGNIGHWWLIPCFSEMDHRAIHAMGHARKPYEKKMFVRVVERYRTMNGLENPLPPGVFDAIMEFHR